MNNPVNVDTRLHFSIKDFHQNGWDKHMLGGAAFAVGGAAFAVGTGLLFTQNQNPTPASMATVALWTGVVAGAAVELMDYIDNKINNPKPPHGVELMDFLFTSLGGALAATAIYLIASLIL